MAKLVDALDLGPSNFCFESSSLSIRNSVIYSKLFKNFKDKQLQTRYASLYTSTIKNFESHFN